MIPTRVAPAMGKNAIYSRPLDRKSWTPRQFLNLAWTLNLYRACLPPFRPPHPMLEPETMRGFRHPVSDRIRAYT